MNERPMMTLANPWRFCPDPHRDGEAMGFWRPDAALPPWREVDVPSCFEAGAPDLDFYEGVCWYRRGFTVPAEWQGRRVVLQFGSVNDRARVWLNGILLGSHRDPFLPFEFEVGSHLRWDGPNTLAVEVDNAHHEGDVPGMHIGWRRHGGILREVRLMALPPVCLAEVRVNADSGGNLTVRSQIRNYSGRAMDVAAQVDILDAEGKTGLSLTGGAAHLEADGMRPGVLEGCLKGALRWSPSSPVLYKAVVRLMARGQAADQVEVPFGFRSIAVTPDGLRLNGEPIFLTGFNRHEDSPRTAMAADPELVRQDLERMKEAGCNFVRLCHYPHDPAELDLCDRLGLLVMCEIPLYFWNNQDEARRTQAARAESASRQLEALIARDFNHPSVILWSVSNETQEEEPGVAADNEALIRQAKALDPSRLCVHVKNQWEQHPRFAADDLVCINTYPTMDFEARGHDPASFDLAGAVARQRERIDGLRRLYPTKPILVTEFGYASFAGTRGHAFGEEVHARSIETEFASFDAPYICGAVIWCWADHPWPAGRFFNGLAVSPFGVVSRERQRLAPFWTARAMFRKRQGLPAQAEAWGPTGNGVIMVRPHMDNIPKVPFADGYGIRPMTLEDIALWTDIERDAEPFFKIGDSLFRTEFGADLESISRRCFILTDSRGLGVGTISAWYDRNFHGEDYGRIHWVAVRAGCQGKGLGKAGLAYAMERLAEWHDKAYLVTSTNRTGAVTMYLNFGFEPDLRPANARAAWSELNDRIHHPVIERALAADSVNKG
jgi:GNAT superfamily N-acetyltransferase